MASLPAKIKKGLLPTPALPDELPGAELTENAQQVLVRRYVRRGDDGQPVETVEEMFWRVAYHIAKAEAFAKKYGAASVLIGRLLPVVPFKVFSIASGITKVPFVPFVVFTMIGVLPRILLLAYFGHAIMQYKKPALLALAFLVLIAVAIKITHMIYNGKKSKNNKKEAI